MFRLKEAGLNPQAARPRPGVRRSDVTCRRNSWSLALGEYGFMPAGRVFIQTANVPHVCPRLYL